jgi:uncharacterized hydantoinase/oxoprolinase family protein
MNQEDIYEMISEAGMNVSNFDRFIGRVWCSDEYPIDEELFRFAALVAAHEREECAKVCDEQYVFYGFDHVFAAGIRARGEK